MQVRACPQRADKCGKTSSYAIKEKKSGGARNVAGIPPDLILGEGVRIHTSIFVMYPSRSTFFTPVASLAAATVHGRLILYLPLNETSGTQATDFSGNNHHGRYVNGPQLQGRDGARLDGNHNCIQLPNDLMWNQYSISASIEVNIRLE